jgi:transcription initiation factor TFIIH subunit 4
MQETDVLSFLFMLGSLELGQDYTTTTLTLTQKHLLDDLSGYGLIYRSSKDSTTFYPTRLAVTLTSDSGALSAEPLSSSLAPSSRTGAQKGFIIIETNYRLYAYTSSLLQIAVLSLFTNLTTRFPNLVSGKLTKKSISRAVSSGITSSQILSYLTAHAHPQMQRSESFIPPTVMDQIRLWEYEGERVETTLGFLMKEFNGRREYEDVAGYAESLGVLIWRDDKDMKFFVDKLDQVSAYLSRRNRR